MGIMIVRRCCAGVLLALPWAMPWAQDLLPPPAERVQRQADNPLRWIIEAGKLKSRGKPAAESDAAPHTQSEKAPARSSQAKAPARASEPAARVAASTPKASAGTRVATEDPAPPPPPAALELVSDAAMVLPDAIYEQLRSDAELELQFTVNTDGSVSDVTVQASNNPNVDAAALTGVRGWRFKPIAQAQVHSVQLVFHPRP